jgi:hypothetical protein
MTKKAPKNLENNISGRNFGQHTKIALMPTFALILAFLRTR